MIHDGDYYSIVNKDKILSLLEMIEQNIILLTTENSYDTILCSQDLWARILILQHIWRYYQIVLGKHWRDTKGGAPFQCSPESDLDFHVEPNEFHMTVCLGRPRLPRELYKKQVKVCLSSNRWIRKLLVATCILQIL